MAGESVVISDDWNEGIARAVELGRAVWPGVEVDLRGFAVWLEQRADGARQLARLHVADLYLACALRQRDPAAVRVFDRELGRDLAAAARAAGADDATAAEVRQQVTADVLVGDADGPRIASYAGRGELRGWLRSVAVRTTWKLLARARRDAPLDEEFAGGLVEDPEVAHLRERYAAELAIAIEEAMAALTARQRTLLRLAYVDGLTVDVLGRMYAVHRATAARWVAAAREALFEEARLRVEAAVDARMTSVVRLVQSQVHVSLDGWLRERTGAEKGAPP